uniref:Uncharacterized protein n=1 Tax=Anguilla anguilla TaxID=7936 RepID=A0A0E9TU18_ANGAN
MPHAISLSTSGQSFSPNHEANKKDFFPCSSYRINISSCLVKHWPFCFLSQGLLSDTGE